MKPIDWKDADLSEVLMNWNKESEIALNHINQTASTKLTNLDLQIAVGHALGYSDRESTRVCLHKLNAHEIIKLYEQSVLELPIELAQINLSESIIPKSVPGRLDEQTIKVNGEIWRIHKSDKDPCPSNPHGHNLETGYKLHLGSGALFDSKCKSLNASISKKDLIIIRKELGKKRIVLPSLTR
jgi:hypothetical protein